MTKFWNKYYKAILVTISAISLTLAIISGYYVSIGKFADFTPMLKGFGLPYGAFVWGDLLVFSSLWTIVPLILLKIKSSRFFWIAFFGFWLVRSLGETNYWFLQQFHPETIPWPQYFDKTWIFKNLTDPEFWVFFQIRQQSVAVLSLLGLVYELVMAIKEN